MGFGWGELFELNLYSTVLGVPIDDLIAGATFDEASGEYDFAWGEIRKALTDDQLALLEGLPRNLGQMVSADKRHHGRDEHQPEHAAVADEEQSAATRHDGEEKPGKRPKPDHAGRGGRSER